MPISSTQARAQFTNKLIAGLRMIPEVGSFLRSFAPAEQAFSKYVSFDVERNGEQIAVDVLRGTEANRNTFAQNMNKLFLTPFYFEDFDATQLDLYDRAFGSPMIDEGVMSDLLKVMALRISQLRNKIERATENQWAQVLTNGIVTLVSGDNIDYKRKAGSIVDLGAGNYWDSPGIDPYATLETGGDWIRENARVPLFEINVIFGSKAWNAWKNNGNVQAINTLRNWKFDDYVRNEQRPGGAIYHGSCDAGSYRMNIYSYKELYQQNVKIDAAKTNTYFLDQTKIYMFPLKPHFKTVYAAVPQLLRVNGVTSDGSTTPPLVAEPYVLSDYQDDRVTAHVWNVKSAPLAMPQLPDEMYTAKVVAA